MLQRISYAARFLTVRLIVGFVAVMVATLLVVGIPTLWLIRGDLERQAHARLAQGANSTQAIYAARQREIQALVNLTAARPTLRQLLARRDRAALSAYLETLRAAPPLDFLAAYDASNQLVAGARLPPGWNNPALAASPGVQRISENPPAFALTSSASIRDDNGARVGMVVGGVLLDDHFVGTLGAETGLQHNLFGDGVRLAASLSPLPARVEQVNPGLYSSGANSFFLQPLTLETNLTDVLALPANDIVTAQTRVLQVLFASAAALTLLAASLGYVLAQRVTAPLRQLVAASEDIGRGNLETPIPTPASVVEVRVLARTLERMRSRLHGAYADLARAKTWSENLIASLAEGVLTVDAAGRITSFSPGAERLLGWRATDVIGRSLPTLWQDGKQVFPAHSPPGSVRRELVSTRDGRQRMLLITSGAVTPRDDGAAEQALVFRDVTEEEEALRLREFFLANVSHELKTPLSTLRASVELLATELGSLTPDEQTELVNSLWLGTLRLEELIDNLLSSASIQSGQFQVRLRSTDLESVVEEVMLTTRPLLLLRGQRLELDLPPALPGVWADPRRLAQVLVNLISNASKYGPENAPITIRAQVKARQILVQVADEGPGIAAEMQPLLFQPFKRSDDPARGGVGLGLAVVRTIVERHGGEVGVNSAPGGGSTFWFTLNLCEEK
jgi:two-component system, OmpR family, sensor histidine kinase ResE